MKKTAKIFGILSAIAAMPFLYSCDDDEDYVAGEVPDTMQVYFSNSASSSVSLSSSETSFSVTVYRIVTDAAASIPLEAIDTNAVFTIPSTVDFAAGTSETSVTIEFEPDSLEYDKSYYVSLSIPDDYTTPYGMSSYAFTVVMPAPWTSLGKATYTDDYLGGLFGVSPITYQVEIQENDTAPGLFRLVNPYGASYPYNEDGDWDDSQDYYIEINATDPDGVYIELQNMGMDWGYGFMYAYSYASYYMDYGYDLETIKSNGYCGTYADGVITFPSRTLLIYMPDYSSSLYYANTNGAFQIVLPGYTVSDYSIEVSYTGQLTTPTEAHYVLSKVTFAGEDVEYARVALVEGSDYETAAQSIIDGTVEYTEISASGSVQFSCEESGKYMIVAVSYGSDEAQEYDYASFQYTIGADPWTSLGMATYTDDIVGSAFGAEPVTYEVEIQESDDTPGLFRLVNPYGASYPYNEDGDWDDSMNYYMEIDASDPVGVYINYQDLGVDWGYGDFFVYSYASYYMDYYEYDLETIKSKGYCGTYADGVITFPIGTLLYTMSDYSSNLYKGNPNGAFKVVMPGYETTAVNSVDSRSCSKTFNPSAKKVGRTLIKTAERFK